MLDPQFPLGINLSALPRPHDLLWCSGLDGLQPQLGNSSLPGWVMDGWSLVEGWPVVEGWPLVVRRAHLRHCDESQRSYLPVGLRGRHRSQRFASWLNVASVTRCVTPESLVDTQAWNGYPELAHVACVSMLSRLLPDLSALGLPWGPTGSVGFALTTGIPVIREESDLDLVIRAEVPFTVEQEMLLRRVEQQSAKPCRLDIQIDTGEGGFALSEYLRGANKLLIKTNSGPVLTTSPWTTLPANAA